MWWKTSSRGRGSPRCATSGQETLSEIAKALTAGEVDLTLLFNPPFLLQLEAGDPLVLLAGVHVGCFELFGSARVRSIRDLKGKTVAVTGPGGPEHVFVASMAAYVGLDPRKDIHWVSHPQAEAMPLHAAGQIDALLAFPPLRRNYDRNRPRPWWSTAARIGLGPSTSAVWWSRTGSSSGNIQ